MIDLLNVQQGIEILKKEIIDAIKERVDEIGKGMSIQVYPICLTEASSHSRGVRNTLEVRALYVNEVNVLCGDFVCLNDGKECGILFGKSMEGMFLEDLYKILTGLHGKGWLSHGDSAKKLSGGKRTGSLGMEIWKNRLLRKGA